MDDKSVEIEGPASDSQQLPEVQGAAVSMTKRDLIDEIVRLYPAYSRRDAEVIVNAVFDSMTEALCTGERIEIRGFGSFVVKQRRAREGRNPKTGEIVAVAAKKVPFFKVGKELKQRVDRHETLAERPKHALTGDSTNL